MSRFRRAITRLRHRRGHGVHSPYVYDIVRSVLMDGGRYAAFEGALYARLLEIGVSEQAAAEIERLRHHCGFSSVSIDSEEECELLILSKETSQESIDKTTKLSAQRGTTVVILSPHIDPARERQCEQIILEHHSTTILRKQYLLIFNNHLPKQHFIL